ncbi:MAG: hypothetical protein AABP62_17620 [Planctomycetota bacterium]
MNYMLLLLAAALWPGSVEAASVQASKDCSVAPCTVVTASFTIIGTPKTIHWNATYTGTPTEGHSFYLTTNPASNMADIPLTTSGQLSGTKVLTAGTYYISIKLAVMGPGFYTITYNPSSTGDPHITTTNGARYDFQAAGEFIFLRNPGGLEIQVRQEPVATKANPADENAAGVSINTAIAARVGSHRVTYEPKFGGRPDPTGLQLRVDGKLAELGEQAIDLGSGSRITRTNAPGGLRIDFPDGSYLFVTPGWWADQGKWYLNIDVMPTDEAFGIAGAIGPNTWLPALPDGSSMGAMPESSHDRHVNLNQKFADAWRVTDANSLFDYEAGTSTTTFTNRSWPSERPPHDVPGTTPAQPIAEELARAASQAVRGSENANCVYDVMVTGNPGFASTYALSQSVLANLVTEPDPFRTETAPSKTETAPSRVVTETAPSRWIWILLGVLLGILISLMFCVLVLKRKKA